MYKITAGATYVRGGFKTRNNARKWLRKQLGTNTYKPLGFAIRVQ